MARGLLFLVNLFRVAAIIRPTSGKTVGIDQFTGTQTASHPFYGYKIHHSIGLRKPVKPGIKKVGGKPLVLKIGK